VKLQIELAADATKQACVNLW